MRFESPKLVVCLKVLAYFGTAFFAYPLYLPKGYPIPREVAFIAIFCILAWVMFWLALAFIVDSCARMAWHAERSDGSADDADDLQD